MRFCAASLLLIALTVLGPAADTSRAQNQTDAKIRLMAEALTARDAGDFVGARRKLEQLNSLVPNDPGVRRLMAEMEAKEAERQAMLANPPPPPAPEAAAPAMVSAAPPETRLPSAEKASPTSRAPNRTPPLFSDGTMPSRNAKPAGEVTIPPTSAPVPTRPETVEQVSGIAVITEEKPAGPVGPPDRYAEALAKVEKEGVAFARAGDDRLEKLMTYVQAQRALARVYAHDGNFATATSTLDEALASLRSSIDDLREERRDYVLKEIEARDANKGIRLRHRR